MMVDRMAKRRQPGNGLCIVSQQKLISMILAMAKAMTRITATATATAIAIGLAGSPNAMAREMSKAAGSKISDKSPSGKISARKRSGLKSARTKAQAKAHAATQPPAPTYQPTAFVAKRVGRVLAELKSRPIRPATGAVSVIELESDAQKGEWLASVYERNLVEASWGTEMLADKLILARVLEAELGPKAAAYYPRTMGLKEFLIKYGLVNASGEINADGDRVEAALFEEFPAGFVARPAVGVAPQETGRGLFPDTDKFVVELIRPGSLLYRSSHMRAPVKSHILNAIASGEAIVLQEDLVRASDARKPLKTRFFQEARVHSYEERVVEGAVPERWVQTNLLTREQTRKAEAFVGEFLHALPVSLLTRQAWGIDVAVMDNGEMRVIDVVTNRGRRIQWSSYLEQPRVIGAYARHFENFYGLRYRGVSGYLIRANFANYLPFWEKRIDKAPSGLAKVLAYLPPVPWGTL
jgi:hypothetical protein